MIRITHVITGLDQGGAEATLTRLLLGLDRNVFDQAVVLLQVLLCSTRSVSMYVLIVFIAAAG